LVLGNKGCQSALKKIISIQSKVEQSSTALEIVKQLKILLEKDDTAANELFLENEALLLENFGIDRFISNKSDEG